METYVIEGDFYCTSALVRNYLNLLRNCHINWSRKVVFWISEIFLI